MSTAWLFPGQGAQHVGMGKDIHDASPAARDVFDAAEETTALELRKLCFEGPEDELARTDVAQPAIFTVSAATLAALREQLGDDALEAIAPDTTAGLSLGEYTALYAAGALDLPDALRLVARRGELMQQAATAVPSGMVSVLGLDEAGAEKLCDAARDGQVLTCANFNCPGQVVLSGEADAVRRAEELAEAYGAKGAMPLKVAGAFHSEIMAPAVERLAEALADVTFRAPKVEVYSNVTARPYGGPEEIRQGLLDQLVSPVRWQQCMENMLADGLEKFYEIGPGRVLAGLMRRTHRRADFTSIPSFQVVEKLASTEG